MGSKNSTNVRDSTSAGIGILLVAVGVLVVSMLGGGGHGGLGDLIAQQLAIVLLGVLAWQSVHGRLEWSAPAWVRWLPALAIALPLLQLLPIPMQWWTSSPARTELAMQLSRAGVVPIHVISLNPGATERSLWSLLPATALFLATLALSKKGRYVLLAVILSLAAANVLLGMAQLADGPESGLRIYSPTNVLSSVGFFANRNHLASLLVMSLPLALAGTASLLKERATGRRISPGWIFAGCGLVVVLIVGIALSKSRAGVLLGMLALLGSFPLVMTLGSRRGSRRVIAATVGVAVLLSMQFALVGLLQRIDKDPLDDSRWQYARVTLEAAKDYSPLGSGLGTFRQAYQPYEARGTPENTYVNHAHDDYLELWLEGGIPAVLLLVAGLAAWVLRGVQLCGREERGTPGSQLRFWNRAAWLSATMILAHSALDYPLRTTAAMSVFAIVVAIAFVRSDRATASAD